MEGEKEKWKKDKDVEIKGPDISRTKFSCFVRHFITYKANVFLVD